MIPDPFDKLLTFHQRLKQARIHYELAGYREDAVSVTVRVPGEYWEVDFLADGDVDVERFVSIGGVQEEALLEELFAKFSDADVTSHDSAARE
jgi:hypothetical protein